MNSSDASPADFTNQPLTIGLYGLGVMGASLALKLREYSQWKLIGFGHRWETLEKAQQQGIITNIAADLCAPEQLSQLDLLIICTPVNTIEPLVKQVVQSHQGDRSLLVTDVGSTKQSICESLSHLTGGKVRFLGSHPMAGTEKSGFAHASPNLFNQKTAVLTPLPEHQSQDIALLKGLWEAVGSEVLCLDPEAHDFCVAKISHLPHLVASALACVATEDCIPLASSGFRDTTRIAKGSVEMWTAIFQENRAQMLATLSEFEAVISQFRKAIENQQQDALAKLLEQGKEMREQFPVDES